MSEDVEALGLKGSKKKKGKKMDEDFVVRPCPSHGIHSFDLIVAFDPLACPQTPGRE
jgi:hypothetical protein